MNLDTETEAYVLELSERAKAQGMTLLDLLRSLYQAGEMTNRDAFIAGALILDLEQMGVDRGEEPDYSLAHELLGMAAAQDNANACFYLGDLHENGIGTPKDAAIAAAWYGKAAELGHTDAQFCMGLSWLHGDGVEKNPGAAAYWFEKAAQAGDTQAQFLLAGMYKDGVGVRQDHSAAFAWFEKAAQGGNTDAIRDLGTMHCDGLGTPQDFDKAIYYLRRVQESDYPFAAWVIGYIYDINGEMSKAYPWFKKAGDYRLHGDPANKSGNEMTQIIRNAMINNAHIAHSDMTGEQVQNMVNSVLNLSMLAFRGDGFENEISKSSEKST